MSENGTDDRVSFGSPADGSLDFGDDSFTVLLWVLVDDATLPPGGSVRTLLAKGQSETAPGYYLSMNGTGNIQFGIGAASGNAADCMGMESVTEFADGNWHHVAVIVDRDAFEARLLVDGVLRSLVIPGGRGGTIAGENSEVCIFGDLGNITPSSPASGLYLASRGGTADFLKGCVDDLHIYRRALSSAEADAIRNKDLDDTGNGTFGDELPDWWEITHFGSIGAYGGWSDPDADSFPNIFEWKNQSNPTDFTSIPPAAASVQSGQSIQDALDELLTDYAVVTVGPGTYGAFYIDERPAMVVATAGPRSTQVVEDADLNFELETVGFYVNGAVVGFEISHLPGSMGPGLYLSSSVDPVRAFVANCVISGNSVDEFGGGIQLDGEVELVLVNSIVRDNDAGRDGGGLVNFGGSVKATNCTFWANSATYTGRSAYNLGMGTIDLVRSIVWSDASGSNELGGDTAGFSVSESIVRAGYQGAGNHAVFPDLTLLGFERSTSDSRSLLSTAGSPAMDIDSEPRGGDGMADIGADEFIDTDGDLLPDAWELWVAAADSGDDIETLADIHPEMDVDLDDLSMLEEFDSGTNPLAGDTDSDGLGDGSELAAGLDPLVSNAGLDSDDDGFSDTAEIAAGMVALIADSPRAVNAIVKAEAGVPTPIAFGFQGGHSATRNFVVVSGPAGGTLETIAGARVYTSNAGFSGWDEIRFRYDDGSMVGTTARLSIYVKAALAATEVSAGENLSIIFGQTANLSGTVTGPGAAETLWVGSGPGDVVFADRRSVTTTATFSSPGTYTLKLLAKSETVLGKSVQVQVNAAASGYESATIEVDAPVPNVGQPVQFTLTLPQGAPAPDRVEFYSGTHLVAQATDGATTAEWTPTSSAHLLFTAKVFSTSGDAAFTDGVPIAINTEVGVPPSGTLPSPDPEDPSGDSDEDGMTDTEEIYAETSPFKKDTDHDWVEDPEDGFSNDSNYSPPRLPESKYVVIPVMEGIPVDMNAAGEVLVRTKVQYAPGGGFASLNPMTFYLWRAGEITLIGQHNWIEGMNDNGAMVGQRLIQSQWGNDPGEHYQGILLNPPWKQPFYLNLSGPNGTERILPNDIANNGQMIGLHETPGDPGDSRTVIGTDGNWTTVHEIGLLDECRIKRSGCYILPIGANTWRSSTFFDPENGVHDVPFSAVALNDVQEYCGARYWGTVNYSLPVHPRFGRAGQYTTELVPPLPALYGELSDLNNRHEAVGGFANYSLSGGYYSGHGHTAMIYRNGVMRNLNDLIDTKPSDNFHVMWATAINDSGTIAAGAYLDGKEQVVLLVPVEVVADTNRDGDVNPAADNSANGEWTYQRGAIYSVNFDRDETDQNKNLHNGVPMPDAINFGDDGHADYENYEIVNAQDEDDIAPFKIRAFKGLPEDYRVFLRVDEEESMRAVHIFKKIEAEEEAIWGSHMDPATASPSPAPWVGNGVGKVEAGSALNLERDISMWVNENHPDYQETRSDPANEDYYTFGMEGLLLRGMKVPGGTLNQITGDSNDAGKFSGEILLHLEIRDSEDTVVGTDSIRLSVAPWLALSHEEAAEALYIANAPENQETRDAPPSGPDNRYVGLSDCGVIMTPIDVTDGAGWWFQDHIEIGYTQRPGGPRTHLVFRLPYVRDEDGDGQDDPQPSWPRDLLGPDMGIFQLGNRAADGWTGGDNGGNLECLPPSPSQPLGRIVMGNTVSEKMKQFLRAQRDNYQTVGASFIPSTDWLAVGHIDEYAAFLSPDDTGRRVLIASSQLAIQTLEDENQIPHAERHLKVFFAADPAAPVVEGVVTEDVTSADNRTIQTSLDPWPEGAGRMVDGKRIAYMRFFEGEAQGQVARVQLGEHGVAEVQADELLRQGDTWGVTGALWDSGTTVGSYNDARQVAPMGAWRTPPEHDTRFILVPDSLRWQTVRDLVSGDAIAWGMPAVITVKEVLGDVLFRNLNYNQLQTKLNLAKDQIRAASGGEPIRFVPVPALWFATASAPNYVVSNASAFNPGPTNLQPAGGNLYCARQFGPVNGEERDLFELEIIPTVVEPFKFVNSWNYHRIDGEIHCGTAVRRTIPTEQPWWKKIQP